MANEWKPTEEMRNILRRRPRWADPIEAITAVQPLMYKAALEKVITEIDDLYDDLPAEALDNGDMADGWEMACAKALKIIRAISASV